MTDDHQEIQAALNRIEGQLSEQIRAIHQLEDKSNFWFAPQTPGGKTRAEEIVALTGAVRAGGLVSKALLRIAGAIIVAGTLYTTIKGFMIK